MDKNTQIILKNKSIRPPAKLMHNKTIKISSEHYLPFCLNMKLVYIALFVVPACTGFFAQIRDRVVDHFEQKLKRPECHVEWEDVTTPHCETHHEQVLRSDVKVHFSCSPCAGVCGGVQEPVQDRVQHFLPDRVQHPGEH